MGLLTKQQNHTWNSLFIQIGNVIAGFLLVCCEFNGNVIENKFLTNATSQRYSEAERNLIKLLKHFPEFAIKDSEHNTSKIY